MFRSTEGGIWGLEIWAGFGCPDMLEKVLDLACLYVLRNGQKTDHFWAPDWPDWLKMAHSIRAPDGVDRGSRMTCFGLQNDPF